MPIIIVSLVTLLCAGVLQGCGGGSTSGSAELKPQENVVYFIDDHLGNTHLVTDSLGNVLHEESRYPYGMERQIEAKAKFEGSAQPQPADVVDYVFTGKEYDAETGLIYFGGRYYAPALGRWITADPLFLEKEPSTIVEMPGEMNLYAYVQNNPMTYRDATGFRADAGLEDGKWYGKIDDMGKSMPRMNATAAELIVTDALALAPVAGPLMIAGAIKAAPVVASFVGRRPDVVVPILSGIVSAGVQVFAGEQTGFPAPTGEGKTAFWAAQTVFTGLERCVELRSDMHAERWNRMVSHELLSDTGLTTDLHVTSEISVSLEPMSFE